MKGRNALVVGAMLALATTFGVLIFTGRSVSRAGYSLSPIAVWASGGGESVSHFKFQQKLLFRCLKVDFGLGQGSIESWNIHVGPQRSYLLQAGMKSVLPSRTARQRRSTSKFVPFVPNPATITSMPLPSIKSRPHRFSIQKFEMQSI